MSVNVSVDDANTCDRKLLEGAIDFAVCGEPELILENYFDPFFHDSLNVIVSDRHPLAAKASINLEDLENECLIFTPANCPIRIQIEQHLRRSIGDRYRKMELTSEHGSPILCQGKYRRLNLYGDGALRADRGHEGHSDP